MANNEKYEWGVIIPERPYLESYVMHYPGFSETQAQHAAERAGEGAKVVRRKVVRYEWEDVTDGG